MRGRMYHGSHGQSRTRTHAARRIRTPPPRTSRDRPRLSLAKRRARCGVTNLANPSRRCNRKEQDADVHSTQPRQEDHRTWFSTPERRPIDITHHVDHLPIHRVLTEFGRVFIAALMLRRIGREIKTTGVFLQKQSAAAADKPGSATPVIRKQPRSNAGKTKAGGCRATTTKN